MAKFNLENYETVEDRLKQYWKDNPQGRISTDVVHITDDGTCVTIKAEIFVWNEDVGLYCVATGIAQETKGQGGFANTDAWMENCETSAIGRALANWKYQGSGKARPSQQEMSKVGNTKPKQEAPKKKPIVQEEQISPSSITEPQIKEMVFTMCNEDKQFAKKCYETTMTRIKMDKNVSSNVGEWSNDTVDKFLKLVESYVDKYKDDFKERANNSEVINNTLDILDAKIVEKKEQEDMADIPEGKWMEDPISDGQKNFINSLIEQCIDAGLDELGAEGKSYLNGGGATKGNASAMIDKLKSALS
jgi:hypothetical protein